MGSILQKAIAKSLHPFYVLGYLFWRIKLNS